MLCLYQARKHAGDLATLLQLADSNLDPVMSGSRLSIGVSDLRALFEKSQVASFVQGSRLSPRESLSNAEDLHSRKRQFGSVALEPEDWDSLAEAQAAEDMDSTVDGATASHHHHASTADLRRTSFSVSDEVGCDPAGLAQLKRGLW